MKKTAVSLAIVLGLLFSATAVGASMLTPGLDILSAEIDMTVCAPRGETVTFTADQFASAAGADSCQSIEISSLPSENAGKLYFGDVLATEGQVIPESAVSKLCFVPEDDTVGASFGFSFDGEYAMTCNLVFTDAENKSPTALSAPEFCAFTNGCASGEMRAHDADGDSLFFEVVKYPENGELRYDSKTGEFTYTAGSRVCGDSFTFRVKDSAGNLSKSCEYTVAVTENETGKSFCDMEDSTAAAAAVVMAQEGYMTYVEDKGKMYFAPNEEVSRLDFLVTAMNVFGAANIPKTENTGFADDSSIPEKYKGYVYSAAKLGIIGDASAAGDSLFRPSDPVTRAEASVILNNIIGYKPKTVSTVSGVPEWASDAVSAMYELGIYDLENGEAASGKALTKETAADMLYKVYYLIGE